MNFENGYNFRQKLELREKRVNDFLIRLILITGHIFRSRYHSLESGLSDLSISLDDDKPQVFASTTDPDNLADKLGQVGGSDDAKNNTVNPVESRPKVYFSTKFDIIATDDEECEPPIGSNQTRMGGVGR